MPTDTSLERRLRLNDRTRRRIDELAPVSTADDGFRVGGQHCTSCGAELVLESEEEPGSLALGVALGGYSRRDGVGAMVCDECADKIEHEERKAAERKRLGEKVQSSGLPAKWHALRWSELDDRGCGEREARARKAVFRAAYEWATDADHSTLLIYGDTGSGKTRVAATALWERLRHTPGAHWVSVAQLIAKSRANFGTAEKEEATRILTGTTPVVLDDLDKAGPSEYVRELVFAAIDVRDQANVPMLVTTNFKPTQLGDKYGKAIMSRVAGFDQYELPGPDRRISMDVGGAGA